MIKPAKNWLEWSVFVAGLVLVLGTLGFLVRESLVAAGGPPEVVARLGPLFQQSSRGHDLTRLAIAALSHIDVDPSSLQGVVAVR